MSYFKIGKSILQNTKLALSMELLDANRQGTYLNTSVVGCNTRKYHGLLVTPVKQVGSGSHVLLSSLDESVLLGGAEFKLGIHQFGENYYEPTGNKYLYALTYDKVPCLVYRIGDVLLTKEMLICSEECRVMVRYVLLDSAKDVVLRFKPSLAFRNVDMLSNANYSATTFSRNIESGISSCLYSGYPELFMQMDKYSRFEQKPMWNRGIEYFKEQWRGYDYKEDTFAPGYFETELKKGESVIFSAGLSECDPQLLGEMFNEELKKKRSNDGVRQTLYNAAQTLQVRRNTRETVYKAGYPWFGCRGRDMFIALPGISLSYDDKKLFESVMNSLMPSISNVISGNTSKLQYQDFLNPDILLWMVWCIQNYADKYGFEVTRIKYGDLLTKVISFFMNGEHPSVEFHDNGLLYVKGGWDYALTWMNTVGENGKPITPRSGYIIELNALWYNALMFVDEYATHLNEYSVAEKAREVAENVRSSFTPVFWNGAYLSDFVDGDHHEVSVRPNMLFAVGLKYSPLDEIQKKMVVDMATKELLTPKGLRTLSPKDGSYHGWVGGNQITRDYEIYQGGVFPWLMGIFIDSYLKVYHECGYKFVSRCLVSFPSELYNDCLGTISEVYDATQPFVGRGGISSLMNVGELSRAFKVVEDLEKGEATV